MILFIHTSGQQYPGVVAAVQGYDSLEKVSGFSDEYLLVFIRKKLTLCF